MAERTPLVVVGDALLDRDLCGDTRRLVPDAAAPVVDHCEQWLRPGGAALTALLAAREGRQVTLVTALGDDPAATTLRGLLSEEVRVVPLPIDGALPQKTRVMARGRTIVRVDEGEGRAAGPVTEEALEAVAEARGLLVSDYGRGTAEVMREALFRAACRTPLVWDPHPRGARPVPGTRLVTPTASEADTFARALAARPSGGAERRGEPDLKRTARTAGALAAAWGAASVAVTLGPRGALLTQAASPLLVPAPEQHDGDCCGAGDRFAATAAGALADGALPEEAVRAAVAAATAYVTGGGAPALSRRQPAPARPQQGPLPEAAAPSGGPRREPAVVVREQEGPATPAAEAGEADEIVSRVRSAGGTVVATGGCFDLLHAGHTGLLQAARRTGDCLIVCLNSDASVRRRKGAGRPINSLQDRIRVLRALACVDAVVVFDEDTPLKVLERLRPDVWVKGGDYALADLPETAHLEKWGGQALLLPYLDGRSTTTIAERVQKGGG